MFLGSQSKLVWERKRKDNRITNSTESYSSTVSPTSEGTPTTISQQMLTEPSKMYMITPRTRIFTVSRQQAMVFMIDMSSSLATIQVDSGKVMIGNAYQM